MAVLWFFPQRLLSGTAAVARRYRLVLLCGLWLAGIVGALAALDSYSNRAGDSGTPAARWPAQSQLGLGADGPTLVLIAHPRCPCTRATLGELARLMAQSGGRLHAHVLFLEPSALMEPDWALTDLWRAAERIPGVDVHRDAGGSEARLFGCATSGHVLLYDRAGALRFEGGITASRGHEGENAGTEAILARLADGSLAPAQTRVFGCGLFAPQTTPSSTQPLAACKP